MRALSTRHKYAATYVLIILGILAIGFLIYVVVDRLSSPKASVVLHIPAEEPIAIETPSNSDSPADVEEPAEIPIGIRIGQRAPDFSLQSLDNEDVALSDFLGSVVILDFWASWCGPCKSTMPGLESLAQALAPDVVLIGVSLDQTAAKASNYLEANDFSAMIALYESYTAALAVSRTYAVVGIPKTYVIDRTGIVRYVGHPASLSRQTVERLI
jgi:thiol-disulfide isomerase/thioredoxin